MAKEESGCEVSTNNSRNKEMERRRLSEIQIEIINKN